MFLSLRFLLIEQRLLLLGKLCHSSSWTIWFRFFEVGGPPNEVGSVNLRKHVLDSMFNFLTQRIQLDCNS